MIVLLLYCLIAFPPAEPCTATVCICTGVSADRLSAWLLLLPLYILFMIPWTLVLVVWRQLLVCLDLAREMAGGPRIEPDSEAVNTAASFGVRQWDTAQHWAGLLLVFKTRPVTGRSLRI